MELNFNLPYVFNPGSSQVDNACALRALLELQITLGLAYLQYHAAPPLYASGVVYGRTKIWEPLPSLLLANKQPRKEGGMIIWEPLGVAGGKRRADCKSLAPALVAQNRHNGIPCRCTFRFNPRPDETGFLDFHILVEYLDGSHEDPSRKLGMGADELRWFTSL